MTQGIHETASIHPGAIVEDGARIGEGCVVGPFCHIGPEVVLGARVELKSHVVVTGKTEIGDDTMVFSFAVIGEIPQDLKFKGEQTSLVIGKRNRIREHVTMNCGTEGGGSWASLEMASSSEAALILAPSDAATGTSDIVRWRTT